MFFISCEPVGAIIAGNPDRTRKVATSSRVRVKLIGISQHHSHYCCTEKQSQSGKFLRKSQTPVCLSLPPLCVCVCIGGLGWMSDISMDQLSMFFENRFLIVISRNFQTKGICLTINLLKCSGSQMKGKIIYKVSFIYHNNSVLPCIDL